MSVDLLIFLYVAVLLAGIAAVAVYAELRRKRFEPTPSADRIFRCEQCGFVYTDDADVDRSRCSQCGTLNEPINF
jgi:predicted Zn-ribbon and HTH transcriptional regulator